MMPDLPQNPAFQFDLAKIHASSLFKCVEFTPELDSTNNRALELSEDSSINTPCLVLTSNQTSGRGRGVNQWWSNEGSLTFSLIINPGELNLPVESWPKISLTAGLAVCETIRSLDQNLSPGLKWPNDVFLNGKKVSGLLIETAKNQSNRLVIGIGVNINNSPKQGPEDIQKIATSLMDEIDQRLDMTDFLLNLVNQLLEAWKSLTIAEAMIINSWRRYCILTNRNITITSASEKIIGQCHGIADDGALLLKTDTELRSIYSGTIDQIE